MTIAEGVYGYSGIKGKHVLLTPFFVGVHTKLCQFSF